LFAYVCIVVYFDIVILGLLGGCFVIDERFCGSSSANLGGICDEDWLVFVERNFAAAGVELHIFVCEEEQRHLQKTSQSF
jgi:hypothetical protein